MILLLENWTTDIIQFFSHEKIYNKEIEELDHQFQLGV
jgi:hypothetical protein